MALEGIDGSGKSSILHQLHKDLTEMNYKAIATEEPTKEGLGVILRDYLRNEHSSPFVDALIFAADRIEHYDYVKQMVDKGYIVITDRYKYSSYVYQGSQGVPLPWLKEINKQVPEPDLTIYLQISVDQAMERLNLAKRLVTEKFESKEHLEHISNLYAKLKHNFTEVNAEQSLSEISAEIIGHIKEKL